MKLFFLFFLSISTAYSQVIEQYYNEFGLPIDSVILGEWELEKVEIVNGFYHDEDSNRHFSNNFENHKLYFSTDTLWFYPDLNTVFYRRKKCYTFSMIETLYSKKPTLKLQEINSYKSRKKKKLGKISINHEIISCTNKKLLLLDHQYNIDGFARPTVSYLYTYKKSIKTSRIDSLITGGYWRLCSETHLDFLSEHETQPFEFQNVDTNNSTDCPKNGTTLDFLENSDTLFYSSYGAFDGVLFKGTYRLDTQNKLLYLLNKDLYVYNILLANENQLTLVLNKSLTNKLNQRRKNG
ncbi:MAG: hypothetical protein RL264_651 [Bacteroidota bacterium]|jgi:hypothetical protein